LARPEGKGKRDSDDSQTPFNTPLSPDNTPQASWTAPSCMIDMKEADSADSHFGDLSEYSCNWQLVDQGGFKVATGVQD